MLWPAGHKQSTPCMSIECRQHTERLRDRAAAILKEELAEMRRREKRADVDMTYVKDVIVRCSLQMCGCDPETDQNGSIWCSCLSICSLG
jgi:hypothetical protein